MSIVSEKFGTTKEGAEVTRYTITNKNGLSMSALDYGAIISHLMVPDKNGTLDDIVLGFDNVAGYEVNGCFFACLSDATATGSGMRSLSSTEKRMNWRK